MRIAGTSWTLPGGKRIKVYGIKNFDKNKQDHKKVKVMLKTGSINLANTQIIPEEGFHPHNLDGKVTIEIWSTDISASKVCTLQVSLSKDRWFNAKENGEDIAATLETGGAGSIFLPVQGEPSRMVEDQYSHWGYRDSELYHSRLTTISWQNCG